MRLPRGRRPRPLYRWQTFVYALDAYMLQIGRGRVQRRFRQVAW